MKILLIDDERLDMFITKKLLGTEFNVEGFESIQDAVTWASTNKFDILISDYYLANGKKANDALKAIRVSVQNPFRAIVLSNHIDQQEALELKRAGFSAVIEKPITLEKFKETINSI